METKDRIIVALDNMSHLSSTEIFKRIEAMVPHVGCLKVGLELISSGIAPSIINFIHECGGKVFYDGKFNDIPNTIEKATRAIANMKVEMFNIHVLSGAEAIKKATENKGDALLLGVTILTSFTIPALYQIGFFSQHGFDPDEWEKRPDYRRLYEDTLKLIHHLVKDLALVASRSGCDGIICSPQELEYLKQAESSCAPLKILKRVVPGVRPLWSVANDQKRIMTPKEAIRAGADYLVIGRPITDPPQKIGSPIDAIERIIEEIEEVL